MYSEPILRVEGLTKSYRLYDDPRKRLWEALFLGRRKLHHEFWALRDISFEVGRGESLGIIGRNGSGKSTLLQCIAGTLEPTAGSVETRGRVAALLELGSGFNPEFTGRENVFLACAVQGLPRREALERFDAIAAFADIGEFLDQPVKTYSSGMAVRLAFAVQTAVEPDLLIVDEALAVGDIFFQQKCLARMRALREQGVAVLFVSHDMGMVRDLCARAVYLRGGEAVFIGEQRQAIRAYRQEASGALAGGDSQFGSVVAARNDVPPDVRSRAVWSKAREEVSGGGSGILAVLVRDAAGQDTMKVRMGEALLFDVYFIAGPHARLNVGLVLKNRHDLTVASMGSYLLGLAVPPGAAGSLVRFRLRVSMAIEAGLYTCRVVLGDNPGPDGGARLDETPWLGPLHVDWDYVNDKPPFLGMFGIPVDGEFISVAEGGA